MPCSARSIVFLVFPVFLVSSRNTGVLASPVRLPLRASGALASCHILRDCPMSPMRPKSPMRFAEYLCSRVMPCLPLRASGVLASCLVFRELSGNTKNTKNTGEIAQYIRRHEISSLLFPISYFLLSLLSGIFFVSLLYYPKLQLYCSL